MLPTVKSQLAKPVFGTCRTAHLPLGCLSQPVLEYQVSQLELLARFRIRGVVESRAACAPQACLAALVAAIAEQRAAAGSAGAPSLLFEASEVCPVPQRARACRQAARFYQTTITNAECKAQYAIRDFNRNSHVGLTLGVKRKGSSRYNIVG